MSKRKSEEAPLPRLWGHVVLTLDEDGNVHSELVQLPVGTVGGDDADEDVTE
jgi:hypothetical protein